MKLTTKHALLLLLPAVIFAGCKKDIAEVKNPPVADAGNSQTIQLPVNTATLTGTGTTQNGSVTGYLWSLISGPDIPSIESPSASATIISNLIAGNYYFQFAVIDNAGLVGIDTTSVIVLPAVQQTVTLQPANNIENELNIAGNAIQEGSAHDIDLDAAAWTKGGSTWYIRGAFKFDLSVIPASAIIVSAKLSLYSNPTPINGDLTNANSGSNNSMYIRRITTDWNGITTTWLTQPSTTTADQIVVPHTNLSSLDLVDIDVTTIVNAMRTSGNYGFMMLLQNETTYNIRQFCSSNHSDASKHPKLVIVYQ